VYLNEISFKGTVKKLYLYKFKAYATWFITLIVLQLVGLLFSLGGVGSSGGGSFRVLHVSFDIIFIFTLIWVFSTAIHVARYSLDLDLTFISNRRSISLASLAFLLSSAALGTLTAVLCGMLLRVVMYYIHGGALVAPLGPLVLLGSVLSGFLYTSLAGSLGYLVGTLVRKSRVFTVLIPALAIGTLFIPVKEDAPLFMEAIFFFTQESSPLLLILKPLLSASLLYGGTMVLFNRMEVIK